MTNKLDDLDFELSNSTVTLDIITITETWLTPLFEVSVFNFCSDYQIFRKDRNVRSHGGCAALIHKSILANFVSSYCFEGYIEVLCLKLKIRSQKLLLFVVYRSPSAPQTADDSLIGLFESFTFDSDVLITGDFNLPGLYESGLVNDTCAKYEFLFAELGLIQKVSSPTRRNNILDLVLATDSHLVSNVRVEEPFSSSDHNSIKFDLNMVTGTCDSNCGKFTYDFRGADFDSIADFLELVDWENLFTYDSSVNGMWIVFTDILDYLIDRFVPKRFGKKSRKLSKWSLNTRKAYLAKTKLWRKYRMTKSQINLEKYSDAAKAAKHLSAQDVERTETKVLDSANLKSFYSFINSKLSSQYSIPPLRKNNSVSEKPVDKANMLQDQFSSVFTNDDGKLPYFAKRTDRTLENFDISENMVVKALKNLPSKVSYGPDGIPPLLLKMTRSSIAKPLCRIFNDSLSTGSIPDQWREAKIVPIYKKKGENSDPSNYRPVSLTVAASKVFERIIKDEMMQFLRTNNLITSKQHGFLSRRSTLTNVLRTLNSWFKARSHHKIVHCVYIDFAKAFDTVSHPKLIHKLSMYGFAGNLLTWIKAFLTDRTQYVMVENCKSRTCPVFSGVPQGTVLGPLLFMMYVNDLVDCVQTADISLYADDAKIFDFLPSNVRQSYLLQEDLRRVHEWSNTWQLSVAIQKCSVFVFGNYVDAPQYFLGNVQLDVTREINDLGFMLSQNQKFSAHCAKISKRALRLSAHIFRVFKTRKTKFLLKMFETYVRPIVECGVQVWSPHLLKDIDVIEKVQRSFTKRIPEVRNLSYTDRLKVLKLDSLEQRRIIADLNLCFKIVRNHIDLEFDQFFVYNAYAGTRSHDLKLQIPLAATDTIKNSFSYRIPKIWNYLSQETVSANNLPSFKRMVKNSNLKCFLRGRGVR